jgi:tripartite-type tricarboxylate transporter receptor subunit TctC
LIEAFRKMAQDPDFIKACENRALAIDMKYGDEYAAFFKEQVGIVGGILKDVAGRQ